VGFPASRSSESGTRRASRREGCSGLSAWGGGEVRKGEEGRPTWSKTAMGLEAMKFQSFFKQDLVLLEGDFLMAWRCSEEYFLWWLCSGITRPEESDQL
jgi:hypothetical protein